MFLFFKKIILLINIFPKLPSNYYEMRFFRSFVKENDFVGLCATANNCVKNIAIDNNNNILFITHELSRTGAPKVALEVLKSIKKIYGITPVVFTIRGGDMEQDFIKEGFNIRFINLMPSKKEAFQKFCNQFKLIFVSSGANEFLHYIKYIKTPVIWYSHEIFAHKKTIKGVLSFIKYPKKILCGSPLTKKSIDAIDNKLNTKLLIYGIEEEKCPKIEKNKDKTVFICPASIETRKNQKALIQAVSILPPKIRKQMELYIIGSPLEYKYYNSVIEMAKNINEIKFISNIPLEELFKYYAKADCVVCPSVNDPMPIVVTYTFMFKKLALISDKIGQALLAKDKESALMFNPDDINQLSDYFIDIITNKEKYCEVAKNGRKIFDDYFSLEMFNKELKENLDEYLL